MQQETLNRIEDKIDKVESKLDKVESRLDKYNTLLEVHIKRTEMLEHKMEPVEKHVYLVQKVAGWLLGSAGIGLVAAMIKIFLQIHEFKLNELDWHRCR